MKQKIYEFSVGGEKEWVCADTLIEALKYYYDLTAMSISEFENDDDIIEIPKEKWAEMKITDTEGIEDDETGFPILMTFAEYMETANRCDIIATTNY